MEMELERNGKTKILNNTLFLCQLWELRHLKMHNGCVGCGFVVWFGQYTDIAFLVSLFGDTQPRMEMVVVE